jgi:hypothetical protein
MKTIKGQKRMTALIPRNQRRHPGHAIICGGGEMMT